MKGRLISALLTLLILLLFQRLPQGFAPDEPVAGMIDVITEGRPAREGGERDYYTIDENGRVREIAPFEPDEMVMLVSDYSCFESYIGEKDGQRKVLNRLGNGKLWDLSGAEIDKTPVHERILSLASEMEHEIIQIRIYEVKGYFFACMDFNVNWHWPFKLYYYDRELDRLVYVASFESESPVGIQLGERFL